MFLKCSSFFFIFHFSFFHLFVILFNFLIFSFFFFSFFLFSKCFFPFVFPSLPFFHFSFCSSLQTPHPQSEEMRMKLLKKPGLGENLEDHREELECQRSARDAQLNPVLCENLEDLHGNHEEELQCQRSARQTGRTLNWEETIEDLKFQRDHEVLECQRSARRAESSRQCPVALPPTAPPSAAP